MWVAYNSMQCTSLVDFDIYMVTWFIYRKEEKRKTKMKVHGNIRRKIINVFFMSCTKLDAYYIGKHTLVIEYLCDWTIIQRK